MAGPWNTVLACQPKFDPERSSLAKLANSGTTSTDSGRTWPSGATVRMPPLRYGAKLGRIGTWSSGNRRQRGWRPRTIALSMPGFNPGSRTPRKGVPQAPYVLHRNDMHVSEDSGRVVTRASKVNCGYGLLRCAVPGARWIELLNSAGNACTQGVAPTGAHESHKQGMYVYTCTVHAAWRYIQSQPEAKSADPASDTTTEFDHLREEFGQAWAELGPFWASLADPTGVGQFGASLAKSGQVSTIFWRPVRASKMRPMRRSTTGCQETVEVDSCMCVCSLALCLTLCLCLCCWYRCLS